MKPPLHARRRVSGAAGGRLRDVGHTDPDQHRSPHGGSPSSLRTPGVPSNIDEYDWRELPRGVPRTGYQGEWIVGEGDPATKVPLEHRIEIDEVPYRYGWDEEARVAAWAME